MADVSTKAVRDTVKEWKTYLQEIETKLAQIDEQRGEDALLTPEDLQFIALRRPGGAPHVNPCHPPEE